ncbi:hypothetical protein J7E62_17745 [Variovorax paradoxus]|nr:hypothetical protein [Variovorax paradoxus]
MKNERRLPKGLETCYVKAAPELTQAWKHHFMFKNNILHESVHVSVEEVIPKFYCKLGNGAKRLYRNEKATGKGATRRI